MFSTSRVVQGITNRFATSYLVVVHLRNKLCGLWVLGNMGFSLVCPSIVMTVKVPGILTMADSSLPIITSPGRRTVHSYVIVSAC